MGSKPPQVAPRFQTSWRGLNFPNPIGIAGGVDKVGKSLSSWQALGAGFLEVGTVTPLPQSANPGKIMDRSLKDWALWNKMGFPNGGAKAAETHLRSFKKNATVPLFVNIGKNRQTPNASAHEDYISCMKLLAPYADVFVVNISSPNTKSLRSLQTESFLRDFLEPIVAFRDKAAKSTPLLLKMSPDLDLTELETLISTSKSMVDGWILTNTTQARDSGSPFPDVGGVSGGPLKKLSRDRLCQTIERLGADRDGKLIVSVGGVMDAEEVQWRLSHGADLVQTYSGLVFEGPGFFKKVLRALPSQ